MILSFFFFFFFGGGLGNWAGRVYLLGPRRENSQLMYSEEPRSWWFSEKRVFGVFCLFVLVLIICFWLHWAFVALHGLSLVAESRG